MVAGSGPTADEQDGGSVTDAGSVTRSTRVLIVEDHELLTQLLLVAFRDGGINEVTVAGSHELHLAAVMDLALRLRPDVVLLDLHLGTADRGTDYIRPLVATGASVLIMTASDDPMVLGECLEAGASGIFSKVDSFETLADQVRAAACGDTVMTSAARGRLLAQLRQGRSAQHDAHEPFQGLSPREGVVLAGLVRGTTAEEIAVEEHVAVATVRSQIRAVLRKLGVNSQLTAVAMARSADWTGPASD
jgi:two-component system nitrate/nitrite response regulator NarL